MLAYIKLKIIHIYLTWHCGVINQFLTAVSGPCPICQTDLIDSYSEIFCLANKPSPGSKPVRRISIPESSDDPNGCWSLVFPSDFPLFLSPPVCTVQCTCVQQCTVHCTVCHWYCPSVGNLTREQADVPGKYSWKLRKYVTCENVLTMKTQEDSRSSN